jgi:hypothetical protein
MLVRARFALLVLLLLLNTLQAKFLFNDHLISPRAAEQIEKMGSELLQKSAVNAYVVTTHEQLKRGVSVYDFLKRYDSNISKPYVGIVFAPNSKRIHIVSSNKELKSKLDEGTILDFAIKVVAGVDKNSLQSKYDLGVVQAYSELCDQIAQTKGVKLENTIKSGGSWVLKIVNTLIIIGSLIVIWIYFIAPIFRKRSK